MHNNLLFNRMCGSFLFSIKENTKAPPVGLKTPVRQRMIGDVPSWPFTGGDEWRNASDFNCLSRLSEGKGTHVLSMAYRAKHQWNLTHSTFSSKVEREDVVLTTDGEAELYYTSSRKEVLLRKVEPCLKSFYFQHNKMRLIRSCRPLCAHNRLQTKMWNKMNVPRMRDADGGH